VVAAVVLVAAAPLLADAPPAGTTILDPTPCNANFGGCTSRTHYDPTGTPHVVWIESPGRGLEPPVDIVHYFWAGGGWQSERVATGVSGVDPPNFDFAFGPDGQPVIVREETIGNNFFIVSYRRDAAGAWTAGPALSTGRRVRALRADAAGGPVSVAFYLDLDNTDFGDRSLNYASLSSAWSGIQVVDPDVAYPAEDLGVVATSAGPRLTALHWPSGGPQSLAFYWATSPSATSFSSTELYHSSYANDYVEAITLAQAPSGAIGISFAHEDQANMQPAFIAYLEGTPGGSFTLDDGIGSVPHFACNSQTGFCRAITPTTLSYDSTGAPSILYFSKVASRRGGSWLTEQTADPANSVDGQASAGGQRGGDQLGYAFDNYNSGCNCERRLFRAVDLSAIGGPGTGPAETFLFAEGTVRPGFVEYLTIQNPGGVAATATLAFQASNDSGGAVGVPDDVVSVPASSRVTVNVNDWVASRGVPTPLNVSVKLTSDQPLVAERPVYFFANPGAGTVAGGHDVVGMAGAGSPPPASSSTTTTTTTTSPQPPPAPTGLTTSVMGTTVHLSWNPSTGASSYSVYRGTMPGGPYSLLASNLSVTNYDDGATQRGKTYYYVVRAANSAGTSPNSNEAAPPIAPDAPTNLVASTGTNAGDIDLQWSAASGANEYGVFESTATGGPYTFLGTTPDLSVTVTGNTSGNTYYFVVDARNGGGNSGYSNEASAMAA